jgi:hypothetical protein
MRLQFLLSFDSRQLAFCSIGLSSWAVCVITRKSKQLGTFQSRIILKATSKIKDNFVYPQEK